MKTKFTLLTAILFLSLGVFAQAPEKINYQAIARNLAGNPLINTPVNLKFEILQGSATGTAAYSETQSLTTNQFGLFTAKIGAGTVISGVFANILWGSNPYYLRVTVNGDVMPATQLLSVPYALYAKASAGGQQGVPGINCWDTNGNGLQDPSEDINGDGSWNALDCQGDTGVAGTSTTLTAGTGISIVAGAINNTGDLDSTNELQNLNITGTTLSITNGNFVTLPATSAYTAGAGINITGTSISAVDTSTANEIQTISKTGNTVTLSKGGGTFIDAVNDGDTLSTNELQGLSFNSPNLTLSNGGGTINLSGLSGPTYTAGQGIAISAGNVIVNTARDTTVTITSAGATTVTGAYPNFTVSSTDNVNDGDTLSTNELQDLSFTSPILSLSGSVATVNLSGLSGPTYTAGAGINITGTSISAVDTSTTNEIQTISKTGNTITLSKGGGTFIDAVNDGDISSTNELITNFGLNTLNDSLVIDEGGNHFNVALSNFDDGDWTKGTGSIYNTTDSIGIGTATPGAKLHVNSSSTIAILTTGNNAMGTYNITKSNFTNGQVGQGFISGPDTLFQSLKPSKHSFFINYTAPSGQLSKIQIGADTIRLSGRNTNVTTQNGGNFYNQDTVYTDGLYIKDNAVTLGDVLTNIGGGRAQWQAPATGTPAWNLIGNAGTNPPTNFIGTTDALPLIFKTNNVLSGKLDPSSYNSFFGYFSGNNTMTGTSNTAIGAYALSGNTSGITNTAIGLGTLTTNTLGSNNTAIGANANVATQGLTNATAIGANAIVAASNSLVLGNGANVGIGTPTPFTQLDVSAAATERAGQFVSNFSSATDKYGIYALAQGTGTGINYGAVGEATGSTTTNIGVQGSASGSTTNIGVQGSASGAGATNWAGYFDQGNVYIQNKLGIGTLSPSFPLHVRSILGGIQIAADVTNVANGSGFSLLGAGNEYWRIWRNGSGAGNRLDFIYQPTSLTTLSIISSGNVGIGTTTPTQKLDVVGSIQSSLGYKLSGMTNSVLYNSGTTKLILNTSSTGEIRLTQAGASALMISSSGNVGIGTTTPSAKLDINGTVALETMVVLVNPTNNGSINITSNNKSYLRLNAGGSGITLNTTKSITNGSVVGQLLILENAGLNTITIPDNSNVQLKGSSAFIFAYQSTLMLIWNGTNWVEISRSVN